MGVSLARRDKQIGFQICRYGIADNKGLSRAFSGDTPIPIDYCPTDGHCHLDFCIYTYMSKSKWQRNIVKRCAAVPIAFWHQLPMLRTFAKRRFARVISSIRRTTLKCRCFVQPPISMPSPPILWTFANRNTCPVLIFAEQSIRRIQMCIWYQFDIIWYLSGQKNKEVLSFFGTSVLVMFTINEILDSITVYQFVWFRFNCQIKINSYDIAKK